MGLLVCFGFWLGFFVFGVLFCFSILICEYLFKYIFFLHGLGNTDDTVSQRGTQMTSFAGRFYVCGEDLSFLAVRG